jgi:hypothetical protein
VLVVAGPRAGGGPLRRHEPEPAEGLLKNALERRDAGRDDSAMNAG